jgi:hypothetical protein
MKIAMLSYLQGNFPWTLRVQSLTNQIGACGRQAHKPLDIRRKIGFACYATALDLACLASGIAIQSIVGRPRLGPGLWSIGL